MRDELRIVPMTKTEYDEAMNSLLKEPSYEEMKVTLDQMGFPDQPTIHPSVKQIVIGNKVKLHGSERTFFVLDIPQEGLLKLGNTLDDVSGFLVTKNDFVKIV